MSWGSPPRDPVERDGWKNAKASTGKVTGPDKKLLVKKYKTRGSRGMDFGDTSFMAIGRLVNGGLMEAFNRWPYFDITDDGDEVIDLILHPPKRVKWEKRTSDIWVLEKSNSFGLVEKKGAGKYEWIIGVKHGPGDFDTTHSGDATSEQAAKKIVTTRLKGRS